MPDQASIDMPDQASKQDHMVGGTDLVKANEGDKQTQVSLCESVASNEALLAQYLFCLVQRCKQLPANTSFAQICWLVLISMLCLLLARQAPRIS